MLPKKLLIGTMNRKYLVLLQQRTGQLAIGRSTLRNQGAPKVIETARHYLQRIDLSPLKSVTTQNEYIKFIGKHTKLLSNKFPAGAKGNWGAARKSINVFMRDCLYNQYLNKEYSLTKLEKWLEVPLDSDVANNLIKLYASELPRWKSIKSLDINTSNAYQSKALIFAKKEGVARVHLDLKFWRNGNYN